jgi:excinuclease UvrABC ATPase subunit
MKYEDLKCEHCNGQGEKEVNRDGADVPVTCIFCNGSGIHEDMISEIDQIAARLEDTLHGEESKLIGQIRKLLTI